MKNRSVPTDAPLPHIAYQDVAKASAWLSATFGFVEHFRYGSLDGAVSGAQMHLGDSWIMLHCLKAGQLSPAQLGYGTQMVTIFVNDVDAHFARTKAAGAKIVEDLHVTEYGERQYGVEDLDGHCWLFSQHAKDVGPEEWGATLARP
jgi:uncharacterized glyoxalase superfamily protein PhnB